MTFSICNYGESILIDATAAEEQVRDTYVVVEMNKHGELCQIAKFGGASIDPFLLVNCTRQALPKVQELTQFIQQKLEEDRRKRDVGGLIDELRAENDR